MTMRFIVALLLCIQTLSLRMTHLASTGGSAMTAADGSALIAFICIGVVAAILICIILYCLFKQDPYHQDAYARGGEYRQNQG